VFSPGTFMKLLGQVGGFTPATEIIFNIPIGLWTTESKFYQGLGSQMLDNVLDGLNSFGYSLLRLNGFNQDSASQLITEAAKQYTNTSWKISMNLYFPF
jgi:hypothetical protein